MDSNEAATTLLLRGKDKEPVEFPKKQAKRILQLQKETGFTDFTEPAEEAESQPTTDNADHGQPSDSIDTNAPKPEGVKKGK
ncbi:hypothetical protein GCM10028818_41100 [Spirosoma horti]